MFEFNPDGSIKVPEAVSKKNEDEARKMKYQRCIKIERDLVSTYSPKKCMLHITLSDAFNDNRFIENIYKQFLQRAEVPTKLIKINDKEFNIEVGTDFRRCSDCTSLRNEYREFLDGNFIDKKGSCTFAGRKANFEFEDYFD
ncbi:hypothetical protein HOD20_05600 [archaeon]|jgi:hypothetical protein|nr:hypothetical protein [archaeon]MBT4647725.1 hypothetical protein [archaeon]MBT6821253.1 hypothetical protein [archaeon]MBT7392501.1 hypothetical protein [archaeon]